MAASAKANLPTRIRCARLVSDPAAAFESFRCQKCKLTIITPTPRVFVSVDSKGPSDPTTFVFNTYTRAHKC